MTTIHVQYHSPPRSTYLPDNSDQLLESTRVLDSVQLAFSSFSELQPTRLDSTRLAATLVRAISCRELRFLYRSN